MPSFFINDEYNFRWQIGSSTNGLNKLPIRSAVRQEYCDITGVLPSSLSAHGSSGLLTYSFWSTSLGSTEFEPLSICGWDLDAQSGIVIPSLYLTKISSGQYGIKFKLHNAVDSTRNINSLRVYYLSFLKSDSSGIYVS